MTSVLRSLGAANTDALISGIAGALAANGITLMDSTAFLADLMARPGVLTVKAPGDDMQADFDFGYGVADAVAGLDVGQTIVVKNRADLVEHKRPYAHDHALVSDFLQAVELLKPTAIVGVSGMPRTFTKPIVEAMARLNRRPIVFALSNPTSKAECTAEEAYTWSEGSAIYASGSPFPPVTHNGKTFVPGQGNNAYIFPGVGLGVIASEAARVTDEMFFVAARALADLVTEDDLAQGRIFPSLTRIREVSAVIATTVAEVSFKRSLTTMNRPPDLSAYVKAQMYDPTYKEYV